MAITAKITLKNDRLSAESSDLLKKAKEDSKTKALLQIMPYQIRTEINLASADLSAPKQAAAVGAARNEASRFEDERLKEIKELVQKLEKLLARSCKRESIVRKEIQKQSVLKKRNL